MTEKSQEELDRLERISRRMGPPAPSRGPRMAVGILIGVLLVIGFGWVFAPAQVRSLLGFGTSRPQEMQQPAAFAEGISTEVPRTESVDTTPLTTELPVAKPKADGLSPEDQLRLDQMEERLRALAEQPGGMTPEQLQAMLDANAAQLREEVRRQLLAQNPVTAGIDPNGAAAEADARRRRARHRAVREDQGRHRRLHLHPDPPPWTCLMPSWLSRLRAPSWIVFLRVFWLEERAARLLRKGRIAESDRAAAQAAALLETIAPPDSQFGIKSSNSPTPPRSCAARQASSKPRS